MEFLMKKLEGRERLGADIVGVTQFNFRETERMSTNVFVWDIKDVLTQLSSSIDKKQITGKVLLGISNYELYVLDTFENVEYERKLVEISGMGTSEKLQAHTYVWGKKDDPNLCGNRDFIDWNNKYLNDLVEMQKVS
ncbi:hypothetical protein AMTRI_Chr12g270210 [Amborella trichopoda]